MWPAPLALALVSGGLVGAGIRCGWLAIGMVAAVGFLLGYETTPDFPGLGLAIETIAGAVIGAATIILVAALSAAHARCDWQRIGVRIVGSWIAASAIMVLALIVGR